MSTYELQQQHTAADSAAEKWAAVAATLNAPIALPGAKVSSRTSFGALVQAGYDPDEVLGAVVSTLSGQALLAKLNADPDGINWDDAYTRVIIDKIIATGAFKTDVAELLRRLSKRSTTLAGGETVTAAQCETDWEKYKAEELARTKQAALSEANDRVIHLIANNPNVARGDVLDAWRTRLNEVWPE